MVASKPKSAPARKRFLFQSPSLRGSGRFTSTCRPRKYRIFVSIPFIAGQWSLLLDNNFAGGFFDLVSIPFIAGQWSLRGLALLCLDEADKFQSPSLRGSGRFACRQERRRPRREVSIPFIAGQWSLPPPPLAPLAARRVFQSPSLRGSGRFENRG